MRRMITKLSNAQILKYSARACCCCKTFHSSPQDTSALPKSKTFLGSLLFWIWKSTQNVVATHTIQGKKNLAPFGDGAATSNLAQQQFCGQSWTIFWAIITDNQSHLRIVACPSESSICPLALLWRPLNMYVQWSRPSCCWTNDAIQRPLNSRHELYFFTMAQQERWKTTRVSRTKKAGSKT